MTVKQMIKRLCGSWPLFCLALASVGVAPKVCGAQGQVGKRYFPATANVEGPFVSDELSVVMERVKEPQDGTNLRTTAGSVKISKRITERFGVSVGEEFRSMKVEADGTKSGFGNFEFGVKHEVWESAEHEAIVSVGLSSEIGGTGAARVKARPYSVISPAVFVAKGFGDLPESARYLRPLAVTGVVGVNVPMRNGSSVADEVTGEMRRETNPVTLTWGGSVQYSLQYLNATVESVNLPKPLNRTTLVVEFPMETVLSGEHKGKTTGMIAPGVVWSGKNFEAGVALQIPINEDSGSGVGAVAQVTFHFGSLLPKSIGKPLAR